MTKVCPCVATRNVAVFPEATLATKRSVISRKNENSLGECGVVVNISGFCGKFAFSTTL